ncbi:hypothetical protein ACF2G4_19745 (plasmid) [Pantoea sp. C3]|uniref:hypothetical protein n=1 Tax=Pantoea phytostimulans TaxID=2769024 RepID=UPI0038F77A51
MSIPRKGSVAHGNPPRGLKVAKSFLKSPSLMLKWWRGMRRLRVRSSAISPMQDDIISLYQQG